VLYFKLIDLREVTVNAIGNSGMSKVYL
jgi:hypothetical protein